MGTYTINTQTPSFSEYLAEEETGAMEPKQLIPADIYFYIESLAPSNAVELRMQQILREACLLLDPNAATMPEVRREDDYIFPDAMPENLIQQTLETLIREVKIGNRASEVVSDFQELFKDPVFWEVGIFVLHALHAESAFRSIPTREYIDFVKWMLSGNKTAKIEALYLDQPMLVQLYRHKVSEEAFNAGIARKGREIAEAFNTEVKEFVNVTVLIGLINRWIQQGKLSADIFNRESMPSFIANNRVNFDAFKIPREDRQSLMRRLIQVPEIHHLLETTSILSLDRGGRIPSLLLLSGIFADQLRDRPTSIFDAVKVQSLTLSSRAFDSKRGVSYPHLHKALRRFSSGKQEAETILLVDLKGHHHGKMGKLKEIIRLLISRIDSAWHPDIVSVGMNASNDISMDMIGLPLSGRRALDQLNEIDDKEPYMGLEYMLNPYGGTFGGNFMLVPRAVWRHIGHDKQRASSETINPKRGD